MNTKEQAEREYRAQWIRETTREFMIAHLSVGAETRPTIYYESMSGLPGEPGRVMNYEGTPPTVVNPLQEVSARFSILASSLWDRYVEERDK